MRSRLIAIFPLLALASSAFLFSAPSPADGQTPPDDRGRGIVLDGLKRSAPDGPCQGNFEFTRARGSGTTKVPCTHGPDPAPDGVDVRKRRPPEPKTGEDTTPTAGTAESTGSIPCYGNGTDGYRVHVIYARASNIADRYADYASSFVKWTAAVDTVVSASAAETSGTRHVRFVTDANCNLVVSRVTLSTTGDDNLDNTIAELRSKGYDRTDRKYLVYTDANVYCGIGQIYLDDRGDPTPGVNHNNGHIQVPGMVARVDSGCWGLANSVEAHELMHNLGGVQKSAPHATSGLHCTDESDRMCYADGTASTFTYPCASTRENRFDCNHDDYFSTNPPTSSYLATKWNSANNAFLATTEPTATSTTSTTTTTTTTTTTVAPTTTTTVAPTTTTTVAPTASEARYNPLTPARILDTRTGTGAPKAALGPGATLDLQVTGRGGVPASGVSAVVLNVTVTGPTTASFLTVWPAGEARPLTSNLHFTTGQTVANLVAVKVGAGGKVSLFNSAGSVQVIADVGGWYDDGNGTSGARYNSLTPVRILDTRTGNGAPKAALGPGATLDLQVTGRGGVPSSGVSAVVLNVTLTQPTAGGYFTVFPTGETRPLTSNLNFTTGKTLANLVTVKVGTGGNVSLFNSAGSIQVIGDVAGWYDDGTALAGARYNPVTPAPILDTRTGNGAPAAMVGPGNTLDLQVTGRGGVPASGVAAVILNVAVTQPTAGGYLTVFPTGETRPLASNLNYTTGKTVPNLVIVTVGTGGKVSLFNSAATLHLIAEVAGWYDAG